MLRPTDDVADYLSLKLNARLKLGGAASGPALPRQRRRNSSIGSPVTRRRRPSCVAAAERAASLNVIAGKELARAYREAAAKLPEGAKSGSALRPRLFASFETAPSAKSAPNPLAPVASAATRGSRCRSRRLWRRRRGWSRTRKPISSPRPASGSPRSLATRKALGVDRHRRRAHAQLAVPARGERSARSARRSRARGGHRIALKGGLPPPCCIVSSPCSTRSTTRCDSAVG